MSQELESGSSLITVFLVDCCCHCVVRCWPEWGAGTELKERVINASSCQRCAYSCDCNSAFCTDRHVAYPCGRQSLSAVAIPMAVRVSFAIVGGVLWWVVRALFAHRHPAMRSSVRPDRVQ